MKRLTACLMLAVYLMLSVPAAVAEARKFSGTFYDSFDTITTLIGYTESQEGFDAVLEDTRLMMLKYHRIFDGYTEYEGIHNLWYINRYAGQSPVPAEPELIELLQWASEKQRMFHGKVNIALGSVLSVWHGYRTEGTEVPPVELLQERSGHTDIEDLIIDAEAGTVFFSDPEMTIDLGAVAKGYTVEKVATQLLDLRMPSFILNAGGNIRCGDKPMDGRKVWGIGLQDPTGGNTYTDVVYIRNLSAVTSGDYQRYYTVDGVRYHHLIDPDTLMPGTCHHSVTVVTGDSGYADMLSTALFLMPYEEGRKLVDSLDGVEAYWVLSDYSIQYTVGMTALLNSTGASAR